MPRYLEDGGRALFFSVRGCTPKVLSVGVQVAHFRAIVRRFIKARVGHVLVREGQGEYAEDNFDYID